MSSLAGQSAPITGGGSGIGLACATHLARDGATVVLAGRNAEKLSAAAAAVHTIVCDVTHEAQVQAACALAAEVGRFNIRPSMVPTDISVGLTGSPTSWPTISTRCRWRGSARRLSRQQCQQLSHRRRHHHRWRLPLVLKHPVCKARRRAAQSNTWVRIPARPGMLAPFAAQGRATVTPWL